MIRNFFKNLFRAIKKNKSECSRHHKHVYAHVDRQRVINHEGKERWYESASVCKHCLQPHPSIPLRLYGDI